MTLKLVRAIPNAGMWAVLDVFGSLNFKRIGVFDVYPSRDQGVGPSLAVERGFKLTRVGLQPSETLPTLCEPPLLNALSWAPNTVLGHLLR